MVDQQSNICGLVLLAEAAALIRDIIPNSELSPSSTNSQTMETCDPSMINCACNRCQDFSISDYMCVGTVQKSRVVCARCRDRRCPCIVCGKERSKYKPGRVCACSRLTKKKEVLKSRKQNMKDKQMKQKHKVYSIAYLIE